MPFTNNASLIQTPNGRWTWVGQVPTSLVSDDPEVQVALAHCGGTIARLVAKRRGSRYTTSYESKIEAEQAMEEALK